jgi:hypothetical protein
MNWSNLNPVTVPDWLTDELKAEAEKIEQERCGIIAERQAIDAEAQRLEGADVADALAGASDLRQSVAACLQHELCWREAVDAYFASLIPASSAEVTAASEAIEAVEAEIVKWLERGPKNLGGYETPCVGEPVRGSWSREFILRHPAHLAARARLADAQPNWAHSLRAANSEASKQAMTKLERLKQAALAI